MCPVIGLKLESLLSSDRAPISVLVGAQKYRQGKCQWGVQFSPCMLSC
jgi:hypothetical protein